VEEAQRNSGVPTLKTLGLKQAIAQMMSADIFEGDQKPTTSEPAGDLKPYLSDSTLCTTMALHSPDTRLSAIPHPSVSLDLLPAPLCTADDDTLLLDFGFLYDGSWQLPPYLEESNLISCSADHPVHFAPPMAPRPSKEKSAKRPKLEETTCSHYIRRSTGELISSFNPAVDPEIVRQCLAIK
jgi:hypothetical protein